MSYGAHRFSLVSNCPLTAKPPFFNRSTEKKDDDNENNNNSNNKYNFLL